MIQALRLIDAAIMEGPDGILYEPVHIRFYCLLSAPFAPKAF